MFYVFRVIVGKSLIMNQKDITNDHLYEVDLKEKLNGTKYHSIYINEDEKPG